VKTSRWVWEVPIITDSEGKEYLTSCSSFQNCILSRQGLATVHQTKKTDWSLATLTVDHEKGKDISNYSSSDTEPLTSGRLWAVLSFKLTLIDLSKNDANIYPTKRLFSCDKGWNRFMLAMLRIVNFNLSSNDSFGNAPGEPKLLAW
jgi:hypothetical protein